MWGWGDFVVGLVGVVFNLFMFFGFFFFFFDWQETAGKTKHVVVTGEDNESVIQNPLGYITCILKLLSDN